jgi:lipoprotein-releasing system permease protein
MLGFQETVKEKIYSFSGHIMITRFSSNNSTEEQAMDYNIDLYKNPQNYPHVRHVQEFATKIGVVKTDDDALGVLLKGVGKSFDTKAFNEYLIAGDFIQFQDSGYANEVVLSKIIATKLKKDVGDDIIVHFFQNPPRFRRLKVKGIYETNLSEYFDSRVILTDIGLLQRLNDWPDSVAGGLEVFIDHPSNVDRAGTLIGESMDYDLHIERISDRFIQVFEWLNLLSRQVNILQIIILAVVAVNMISVLLIMVMERTQMIGMLKALGASNSFIRSIFVYNGVHLTLRGLLFGNLLGLGLCFLQDNFGIIKLNPQDYYMSVVPISWHWEVVILLNVLALFLITIILLLPTVAISRIAPIRAIRFD